MIHIRQERRTDHDTVYQVVKTAFATAEHSDGTEHDLVVRLRHSDSFIPELSLVAEVSGDLVGHILFTRAQVAGVAVLALAPLSVLPDYQRQGVGTALLREGHRRARELGYGYCVVLGSEQYYPRVGYVPASRYGIRPPFQVPDENFMALQLREDAPDVSGILQYAEEFGL